ncbi:MAG: exo-alpha-sialidase [Planctomycetaceae bacterium]|nr:exo-alpha-sialidase [Planctomycetaceae bacterium]
MTKLIPLKTVVLALLFVAASGRLPVSAKATSNGVWIDDRVEEMPGMEMGPFVRIDEETILTVDQAQSALISNDEGKSWQKHAVFTEADKYEIRPERAVLRTRQGTIILAFMNGKQRANWNWNQAISDSPGAQLPTCVIRSLDGGRTWQDLQTLHLEWTGAIRDMIQTKSGRVAFTSMMLQHNPGRHSVVTYSSQDEGKSWKRSNIIDLGGVGHHGGVTEATIEQLRDGRVWMLLRTNWKVFWEALSDTDGVYWRTIRPSSIDASSAPGLLKRLTSGRLVLVWNRYFPEGKTEFPLSGGDNQWSEVPVSNHRLELSIMFSADDGKTWSKPVVFARAAKGWIAYPYLFESGPGELWITTMQGGLRLKLAEKDFVKE